MKIKYGFIANSSSDFNTIPKPVECPKCESENVVFIETRYRDDKNELFEKFKCKKCGYIYENKYSFDEQVEAEMTPSKRLVIELTYGKHDACGDAEMVSKMLAGESPDDLESEYEHKMPKYHFEDDD